MSRARRNHDDAPNHDSFLDIVANLVGILIILVMVIGVRAKDAMVEAAATTTATPPPTLPDLDQLQAEMSAARSTAVGLESDIHRIESERQDLDRMLEARRRQRNVLLTAISAVELELERLRGGVREGEEADLELLQQIAAARAELDRLRQDLTAVESAIISPTILEHFPTPLAQTVFGSEEHFRLLGGRVTYVPINELVELLKQDAQQKMQRLREQPSLTETIGPVDGFRMRYTLEKRQVQADSPAGPVQQEVVELTNFDLVPTHDRLGEPVDMALAPDSQFAAQLGQWDADRVTITVWTYPDSFAEYRQLKDELARQGFLTAARPLPEGQPISGSPQGARSSSQ